MSEPTPLTDAEYDRIMLANCLPNCNSIAHNESCPFCYPEAPMADFARVIERTLADQRTALLALADEMERTENQGVAERIREIVK